MKHRINANPLIKISAVSLIMVVLLYTGCSKNFLEIQPPSSLTVDSFYKTSADAESAINAAYAPLQTGSMYSDDYPKVVEGGTDDIIVNNTTALSLDTWSFSTNLAELDAVWQACYEGIFRANLVLQKVPAIDMDGAAKKRILGEGHFLRALYYFHLVTLFGEVPLITEADPEDVSKAKKPKSPINDIYDLMIKDLKVASASLPLKSEYSSSDLGRATKGAAQAYLGKVYLYEKDYPHAEIYLDSVIASGEYHLLDDFSKLWITDNSAESIFEVQYQKVGGNAWATTDGANNDEGQLRGNLNYPQGKGGYANLLPTQDLVDEFEDYDGPTAINGRDPRLFYSIFREGDPYDDIDPVFKADWDPTGYAMKKGLYPVVRDEPSMSRNIVLIRLAGVMLLDAEAANENNEPAKAIKLLNEVRDRPSVGMPHYPTAEYPVSNKQEIFNAIVHGRRVELAFEYDRLDDLRRWGLAEKELGPLGYKSPRNRYFPIPQQEINVNPRLKQNPNY